MDSALTGLYMLGAENKVVGVSSNAYTGSSSRFYAAMDPRIRNQSLPVASSSTAGSLERILALKPDVVIVFSLSKEVVTALEERGIPVFGAFIEKLDDWTTSTGKFSPWEKSPAQPTAPPSWCNSAGERSG